MDASRSRRDGAFTDAVRRAAARLYALLPGTEREFLVSNIWLLATSLAMIVCYAFNLPDPGIILLLAVVHSALTGGWKAGLASAGLASAFSAIYLSLPGKLLRYADTDLRQLIAMTLAGFATVAIIAALRRRHLAAIRGLSRHLREARARVDVERTFQALADEAPVLLWMSDAAGRRFYFNRRWLSYTGSTLRDQRGDGWRNGIYPEDLTGAVDRYALAIRSCDNYESEYRLRTATGEYRWVQDMAVPRVSEDGRLLGYLGCTTDRTERKRVEAELHQLSARLLELQDDERRRIARELHDTTAQNLAAISMHLFILKDAARQLDARYRDNITQGIQLAEQCSQEIRTVSYLLHPPLLDELGLISALRSYTTGFVQRTGIHVDLKIHEIGRLPEEIETTVFRIIQEALTNVHRHSGARQSEVRVIRDPKEVKVIVSDEGRGIPEEKLRMLGEGASLGVGVAGMRERTRQFGGHLRIASSDHGTTITAVLPLGGAR